MEWLIVVAVILAGVAVAIALYIRKRQRIVGQNRVWIIERFGFHTIWTTGRHTLWPFQRAVSDLPWRQEQRFKLYQGHAQGVAFRNGRQTVTVEVAAWPISPFAIQYSVAGGMQANIQAMVGELQQAYQVIARKYSLRESLGFLTDLTVGAGHRGRLSDQKPVVPEAEVAQIDSELQRFVTSFWTKGWRIIGISTYDYEETDRIKEAQDARGAAEYEAEGEAERAKVWILSMAALKAQIVKSVGQLTAEDLETLKPKLDEATEEYFVLNRVKVMGEAATTLILNSADIKNLVVRESIRASL